MRYLPILIALSLSACGVVNPSDMKQAEVVCALHQGVFWVRGHASTTASDLATKCIDGAYFEVSGGKHE